MTLAARLARARASHEQPRLSTDACVLPHDAVVEYVTGTPLVRMMGLSPTAIVDGLNKFAAFLENTAAAPPSAPPSALPRAPPRDVCECGCAVRLLDHAAGCEVCADCGILRAECLNVEPEFRAAPVLSAHATGGIPGVGDRVRTLVRDRARRSCAGDVVHLNSLVGLHEGALETVIHNVDAWETSNVRHEVRAAVGLLHYSLAPMLPRESDLRARIQRRETLGPISPPAPSPARHACPKCGVCVHDARSARYHCRWGRKRRR